MQKFFCDICIGEIEGGIAAFTSVSEGTVLTPPSEGQPSGGLRPKLAQKHKDICLSCAEKIEAFIEELQKKLIKIKK